LPALDRARHGLLSDPGELTTGRMGLAAIEELTRVCRAAAGQEKSVIQHGPSRTSFLGIID
jgi:hypothetical protein